jgi:uncharacterized OB-fold protein
MTPIPPNWAEGFQVYAGPITLGLAESSPETEEFWRALSAGILVVKRCTECGRHLHPRRILCSACQSLELDWVSIRGRATLYTFSTVHRPPTARHAGTPYTVGIVRLQENVHLFSRILAPPDALQIGLGLEVAFDSTIAGYQLPVFRSSETLGVFQTDGGHL